MGLFSKKKVFVSSVVYNLAGDELERPDYLKTLIVGNIVSNNRFSITDTLNKGYINGPGIRLRNFHRWSLDNYSDIGVPQGTLGGSSDITPAMLMPFLPSGADKVQLIEVGPADHSYWASQWMLENESSEFDTAWKADIDPMTNQITITFADTSTEVFSPANWNPSSQYIYVTYLDGDDSRIWIYRIGSGNVTLDSLVHTSNDSGSYLPFIPIRIDNEFLSETYEPEAYALAKKAFRKSTGTNDYDEIIAKVEDNEDLEDIDYAYIMHGVSLNVLENSCRKYLYHFFKKLSGSQDIDQDGYDSWKSAQDAYDAAMVIWAEWKDAQDNPLDPLWGTPEPYVPDPPLQRITSVRIKSTGTLDTNVDMRITWSVIKEETGSGLKKPDAVKDELWFDVLGSYELSDAIITIDNEGVRVPKDEQSVVRLNWQIDEDNWKSLTIVNMVHENYIYKNKHVTITAKEALEDSEESGFLVPLHYETIREMSLVDSTQMCTACTFIVFNCYEIVKVKWYQTGIFKVLLFVVTIAVTVATAGAGAPGILGAAGSVGAALGFTGLSAIIVGTLVNAIAAMIVANIIGKVSTAVLGDKLGSIIGAVASFVAISLGSGLMSGQNLATSWGNLMKAENLFLLTASIGNGVAQFIAAGAMDWQQKTEALTQDYNKESQRITQLYTQNIGYGMGTIDPMSLTDATVGNYIESASQYLERTLLTGSDIAEMSMEMLSDFAQLTTSTELPLNLD